MPATRIDLRELQAPLKASYQQDPEQARITLRVKSRQSDRPTRATGFSWPGTTARATPTEVLAMTRS